MRYASTKLLGLLACLAGTLPASEPELPSGVLTRDSLPTIEGMSTPLGVFCGTTGGRLVVAGGARPEGVDKDAEWLVSDRIYTLSEDAAKWKLLEQRLPRPLAFGLSLAWNDRLLCVGGSDGQKHRREVFALRWHAGEIKIDKLSPLPQPTAFACGGVLNDTLYVAGGLASPSHREPLKTFSALELRGTEEPPAWRELPAWPGQARMLATSAVQDNAFLLFGGTTTTPPKLMTSGIFRRDFDPQGKQLRQLAVEPEASNRQWTHATAREGEVLRDGYRFDPQRGWRRISDLPVALAAAAVPAPSTGQSHVFLLGGWQAAGAPGVSGAARRLQRSDRALVYHAITDTWTSAQTQPLAAEPSRDGRLVPLVSARWGDRIVLPRPRWNEGDTGLAVLSLKPREARRGLRHLDYVSLSLYLAVLVSMGVFFARRGETTSDFFVGSRRVPWWAAGISLFGTKLSSLTFLAIPAMVYQTDWTYLFGVLMTIAVAPVIVWIFLPFFRRTELTSAYEYLEKRFHVSVRLLASFTFLLLHLARMGVVLYLPALALAAVLGVDVYVCILVMGLLATFYTVLGGIEAVIWTDVFQVIVLLGGAALCLVVMIAETPGGLPGFLEIGHSADKFRAVHWSWEITSNGLWVVLVGNFLAILIPYSSDQSLIQRYLTTSTERLAARAIWTNAAITLPTAILFFALGTGLWVFYRTHPSLMSVVAHNDQILPWFVARQLPAGLSGLVIAALCAASMSSLDSSINSMATAVTTDFYRRFRSQSGDRFYLWMARSLTLLFGLAGTASAVWIASLQSDQIWRESFKIVGLLSGGLGGLFVAGIFTRRATGPGMIVGFFASGVVLYLVSSSGIVHFFLYGGVGMLSCVVVGWLASVMLPWGRPGPEGLTVRSLFR